MKYYSINQRGQVPVIILSVLSKFEGMEATKDNFETLDSDVEFIVSGLRQAHGNVDQGVKIGGAWLCPKNNDNSWNLLIEVK